MKMARTKVSFFYPFERWSFLISFCLQLSLTHTVHSKTKVQIRRTNFHYDIKVRIFPEVDWEDEFVPPCISEYRH